MKFYVMIFRFKGILEFVFLFTVQGIYSKIKNCLLLLLFISKTCIVKYFLKCIFFPSFELNWVKKKMLSSSRALQAWFCLYQNGFLWKSIYYFCLKFKSPVMIIKFYVINLRFKCLYIQFLIYSIRYSYTYLKFSYLKLSTIIFIYH